MRPAAAFGKPFTYLAASPAAADHRPPQQQLQTPVPASVLHTFSGTGGGASSGAPTPPVRTSTATGHGTTATGKQKPPPVPPRGEQTRLTTVPAKRSAAGPVCEKPEPATVTAPSPPPPPPPPSPPRTVVSDVDTNLLPPPPPIISPPVTAEPATTKPAITEPATAEPDEDLSASALISKFESGCTVKPTAVITGTTVDQRLPVEVDSGTSTLAESTDDDDNADDDDDDDGEDDGAADIWVRTIESPVKNVHPQKVRHHSDSAIKAVTATSSPPTEKRGSLPGDVAVDEKSSSPPAKDSSRSSFRLSAGSRCSSPALLAVNSQQNKQQSSSDGRKISAAEALGVVAKPCPRILPSSATLDAACRRQSLGNLAESRFGTLLSSSVRSSWAPPSGVQTDVESTQSEPSFDYRRKKFTKRCSSADGRNPVHHHHHHHHYHTMQSGSRAAAARDPDFGAKRAFIQEKLQAAGTKLQNAGIVPSGLPPTPPPPAISAYHMQLHNGGVDCGRPPRSSSCNCGQHQATSRPMFINKRTASAEELLPPPAAVTVAEADRSKHQSKTL